MGTRTHTCAVCVCVCARFNTYTRSSLFSRTLPVYMPPGFFSRIFGKSKGDTERAHRRKAEADRRRLRRALTDASDELQKIQNDILQTTNTIRKRILEKDYIRCNTRVNGLLEALNSSSEREITRMRIEARNDGIRAAVSDMKAANETMGKPDTSALAVSSEYARRVEEAKVMFETMNEMNIDGGANGDSSDDDDDNDHNDDDDDYQQIKRRGGAGRLSAQRYAEVINAPTVPRTRVASDAAAGAAGAAEDPFEFHEVIDYDQIRGFPAVHRAPPSKPPQAAS